MARLKVWRAIGKSVPSSNAGGSEKSAAGTGTVALLTLEDEAIVKGLAAVVSRILCKRLVFF